MGAAAATGGPRLPFPDLLRAVGSQLIVWHHLVFYGPLADVAWPLAPALWDFLYEYGRMAVQLFFVVGGYVSARGIDPHRAPSPRELPAQLWRRYRRIGFPYLATLGLALVANELARGWMVHPSISATPTAPQLLAHALFLHDLLGFEALTAGIWYLAIDFQLTVLTLGVATLGPVLAAALKGRVPAARMTRGLFFALALLSVAVFNRDARWDHWALYFFGSYFLGMLLQWSQRGQVEGAAFWGYAALLGAAGLFDGRPRLLVAAAVGIALALAPRSALLTRVASAPLLSFAGRISYSLFLVHFPVCLVVSAWLTKQVVLTPWAALGGMVLAWGLSLGAAALFHRFVETRFAGAAAGAAPQPAVTHAPVS